jgi:diaminopimelate epimerase
MRFSKWHALGNAYLVVEQPDAGVLYAERVRALSDPESGLATDGVLEITRHDASSAEVVIWNPDGSVAEMSGNGVRIAARWLARRTGADEVVIVSAGRRVPVRMLGDVLAETELDGVSVGDEEVVDAGEEVTLTAASVGNPHAVVRLDGATRDDLLRLGPLLETHPRFPERTNVQLVEPLGAHDLRVLVWERGAGETQSSGSSSVAAAAVAITRGWCESPVTAHLPGGALSVAFADGRAALVGPAVELAEGRTDI